MAIFSCGKELRVVKWRDSVLTLDKVADCLRVSRSTTRKLAKEGKSPGQKIRSRWRFHGEEIDQGLHGREARR